MVIDSTLINPVSELLATPAIWSYIVIGVAWAFTVIFSWFKIPKDMAKTILKYAAIIFGAIATAQKKTYNFEKVTKEFAQEDKLITAITFADAKIKSSKHVSTFNKITKIAGGLANVINTFVPIIKPFLKK